MIARNKSRITRRTGLLATTVALLWAAPAHAQWDEPVYGAFPQRYDGAVHLPAGPGVAFLGRSQGLVIMQPPYVRQFVWHPVVVRGPVPIQRPPYKRPRCVYAERHFCR